MALLTQLANWDQFVLDAPHFEHVRGNLALYVPFVAIGGEDTCIAYMGNTNERETHRCQREVATGPK